MKFELNNKTLSFLKLVLDAAKSAKMRVFFVGGIVRDNILNIKNDDIDLLIEGNAIEFSKYLPSSIVINSTHPDFATLKVQYDDINIDIASTRTESYPFCGCLPVVEKVGVPIEIDFKRRDFSVNALYCELKNIDDEIKFNLIDMVSGVQDIKNKTLRVFHNKSYFDDPTRILRGINFKNRFGFDFSDEDKKLISNSIASIDIDNASRDRIYNVFYKNLKTDFGFEFFMECYNNKYYKMLNNLDIKLDIELVKEIISKFSLSNLERANFLASLIKNEDVKKLNPKNSLAIKNEFDNLSKNLSLAYYYYKTGDDNVFLYKQIKDIKFFITGHDLIELGFEQGSIFKIIFEKLFDEKVKNPNVFISKDDELKFVKTEFPQKQNP